MNPTYTILNIPGNRNRVAIVKDDTTIIIPSVPRGTAREIIVGLYLIDRHKSEAQELRTQLKQSGI